jgi:hypothetical protein
MLPCVRLWLWISAFASLAGWALSAAGQLNRAGYAIAFAVFAIFFFLRARSAGKFRRGDDEKGKHRTSNIQQRTSKEAARTETTGRWMFDVGCSMFPKPGTFLRRFRRPLPLGFGALAVLIFLGGALYPPTHYNAMTYHIPRVLQWLAAERWHWIHTSVTRMNYSGCDFEWLTAPLLLFTKSDRALFVLNFIPFLLLPGLVFSVFTRLGVRARVAWQWMWLFPTGYIYLLQAGSAGNDAFSTVYALAAIDFGCRAWETRRLRDLWLSLLAAALLTGTKPTSLPLLLPWLILIFPLLPLLRRRAASTLLMLAVAAVISFFPSALMNKINCGDWLGTSVESSRLEMHNPLVGVAGNSFEVLQDNFVPPLFPVATGWNQRVLSVVPHAWAMDFQDGFFYAGELPNEDWAGMGFGLSVLLAVSVFANFRHVLGAPASRRRVASSGINENAGGTPVLPGCVPAEFRRLVLIAPWLALLAYCAKAGMATPARLIAPYYPLLLPLLLAGAGQSQIVRRAWWRALAGGVLFLALVVLVLSPDRPLWPARHVLSRLATRHPNSHLISRALEVYTVYAKRSDPLADVRALLPQNLKAVGFIGTADDSDISFWLPFGSRRVEHFLLSDPPERFRREQIEYVVVGGFNLQSRGVTLDAWLQKSGAELVASTNATLKVSEGPQAWFVVRFK